MDERSLLISLKDELDETWVDTTPWRALSLEEKDMVVTGRYRVDLEHDLNPAAPHMPLLHGTIMYTIATYQTLLGLGYLIMAKREPVFAALPAVEFAELRRRIIFATTSLEFRKPIMTTDLVMTLSLQKIHDKYAAHRLVFVDTLVDVNDGSQSVRSSVCVDFRDSLVPGAKPPAG